MAVQNLVAQSVIFISANHSIDNNAILADSLIQTMVSNSVDNAIVEKLWFFQTLSNGVYTGNSVYELTVFCTSTFQTTIQNNIATLQTHFPQYQIQTWGYPLTYGH